MRSDRGRKGSPMQNRESGRTVASPSLVALAGMLALASAMGISRFVYTPILPVMAASLGLGPGTAGLIASANFAGYLSGAIAATARRLPGGRRVWFVGSLAVSALTTMMMGFASGLPEFLLLRFAGGAAGAFVLVLATAAVIETLAEAGRNGLGALHYAGVGVGIALSAIVVALLNSQGVGWRTLWIVTGLIALALTPLPALALRWRAPLAGSAALSAPIGRAMLPLSICHFLFGFGYAVTATFLIAMARAAPETRSVEPLIWTVVGVTAAPSLILWLWVAGRIGSRRAYAIASILESAGVLLAGGWPTPAGLLAGAALLGGTFMGITALGFSVARTAGGAGQERRFAIITIGFSLGQALGPVLGGALAEMSGNYWSASALAASALLLAAVLVIVTAPAARVTEPTSMDC